MNCTEELASPSIDLRCRKGKLTVLDLLRRGAAVLCWIQVDATAKVGGDKVRCGGGGARATVGVREEEEDEGGE